LVCGFDSNVKISGFVAYVLTTLPPSELENRIFRLEGERKSLNDLGALFKTGTSVKHVENITGEAGEIKTSLLTLFDSGADSSGWDAANKVEGSGTNINAAGSANAWPLSRSCLIWLQDTNARPIARPSSRRRGDEGPD
jgi:hypothetical protein